MPEPVSNSSRSDRSLDWCTAELTATGLGVGVGFGEGAAAGAALGETETEPVIELGRLLDSSPALLRRGP